MLPALISYPPIDPYIFRIGKFGLSWYAFIYLFGFVIGYFVVRRRYRRGYVYLERADDLSLLASYEFYGVVLGARIFYILFYNLSYYLENPMEIPAIWHGGLSFHGGLVGGIVALWLFCRRHHGRMLQLMDNIGLAVPLALGLGRVANFINGELYGRVSHVPWAMVFPRGGPEPRHPSQLYEALLEGPVLFFLMWWVSTKRPRDGSVAAVGVMGYGVIRFFVEFFREPDPQLGEVWGPFSMGQIMSLAMVLVGLVFLLLLRGDKKTPPPRSGGEVGWETRY
jgi:phosphatidylglycerol---prolipoprotein diacylglyceryl transferase